MRRLESVVQPNPQLHPEQVLAFGDFRLYRTRKLLLNGTVPVSLGGRALDLLCALVERAGEVVSRDELVAHAWPRTLVEASSLRVHVAALRKALRDGRDGARYIANVPGRGYSFVSDVRVWDDSARGLSALSPHSSLSPLSPLAPLGPLGPLAPPARPARHNMPARLTSVIGRDALLATLVTQLRRSRLLTLTGPGGIGKTALALVAAEAAAGDYRDGACFVDLACVTDAGAVASAVLSALDGDVIHPSGGAAAALLAALAPRHILILLDNCEHLVDAVALLVEQVLRATERVTILTTSREPLSAEGEWVHRLGSLDAATDALSLFIERAQASHQEFSLHPALLDAARGLCERLDGVPLAIEFAAARIGVLGVAGLVSQLADPSALLGSGRRTAMARHRTLRASLAWSDALLSADEQWALQRLATLDGSFTLEQAAAVIAGVQAEQGAVVASGPHIGHGAAIELTLDLVHKSLVMADLGRGCEQQACYRLLAMTRAYALECAAGAAAVAAPGVAAVEKPDAAAVEKPDAAAVAAPGVAAVEKPDAAAVAASDVAADDAYALLRS